MCPLRRSSYISILTTAPKDLGSTGGNAGYANILRLIEVIAGKGVGMECDKFSTGASGDDLQARGAAPIVMGSKGELGDL